MSLPPSNLQNLAQGSEESLRALIQAIMPEAIASSSNGKLSGDAVAKLTEKLTELMGPEVLQEFKQNRNERGELVNEEGLPIVDISEAVDGSMRSIPPPITVEPLIPLATLPPPTQERLREKRNRILDLLEQEERQADLLEQQRESQEKEEILRKRKDEAVREKDKVMQARELQKKMGRALLKNIGKAKEKEDEEKEAQRLRDEEADKRRSPSTKKKTVAFVDEAPLEEVKAESPKSIDWGDMTPAKLQNTKRPTLMSQALLDKHPMKMSVVERVPGGQLTLPKSPRPFPQIRDSDDESDPDNISDSDTEASMDEEELVLEQDDVDVDFARHQREIALEYYKKRGTIGQEAAAALKNHSHDLDEEPEIGSGVTREHTKPAISQFRASRLASAYSASAPMSSDSASISLGGSVLPASSTRTMQGAIRTGKLDAGGRLVGAEADSASEAEDEGMQEVLDLLRKGEVYNLGPDGKYLHAIPPTAPSHPQSSSASSSSHVEESKSSDILPPPSMRSKTSKFKASRATSGRSSSSNEISIPNASISDSLSPSVTPVSHVGRSSPKLSTPTMMVSVVAERAPLAIHSPSPAKSPVQNPSPFSMIVDSPSFPVPQSTGIANPRPPEASMPTMTIDSPSFPPAQSSRRPDRPPTVMAANVLESKRVAPPQSTPQEGNNTEDKHEKKVSRFKAARMES